MLAKDFRGTGVAIVTPFTQDGSIDWEALKKLIDFLSNGKVEYLVVMGTTGENVTITKEEKQEIFSYVARHNLAGLPLVAGIGGNNTAEVLDGLRKTDLSGYSAILSVSPYYNKPNQQGLYHHYKLIAEHSALPVIMYNVPGRTGMNVTAETTLRIANDCPNVIATKEASGNFDQIMQIIKHKPAGFEVISGDDAITLPMIALGSIGVISVVANAYPARFSEMVRLALAENYPAARELHYKFIDIISTLFEEGSPSGVKAYLSEMGVCGNYFRMPVYPVSDKLMGRIRHHIMKCD
ncbi:MAG TPA: 4-hydroxy-tetrahydrodipicolinate synthase [Chitinophagaceae bacterium]|nr:4-hydroxy-tetrahydrodipicolinate synthase [Chitinophagaceae bacterium]